MEELKAKWKYLRDRYLKAKNKVTTYIPSGSASQVPKDPGFKFFWQMRFLDDTMERQPTLTSVTLNRTPLSSPSPAASMSSDSGILTPEEPPSKKKRIQEKTELQKSILEALSTPTPLPDGVDGFLIRLGESLRRMPYRTRSSVEMKIMALVYETEEKLPKV